MLIENRKLFTDNLSSQVYQIIRDSIINNELKPGTRLNFQELQNKFGVSKTPLREALNRLQLDKFVEVRPRSGTYVAIPNMLDIKELYDLRKAIESHAIRLAIPNLSKSLWESLESEILLAEKNAQNDDYTIFFTSDANFHRTIVEGSHNSYFQNIKQTIDDRLQWFRIISATHIGRVMQSSLRHQQIVRACMAGDVSLAQKLLEEHIEEVKLDVMDDFSKRQNIKV